MKKSLLLAALGSFLFTASQPVSAATATATAAAAAESSEAAVTPPAVFRTLDIGERSGCVRPAKMLISDEKEWQRVWNLHSKTQDMKFSPPPVDFSKQVVVALLMGNQPQGSAISTVQIVNGSHDTTIYYSLQYGPRDIATTSQPYHFAVIDKPAGKIRFANCAQESLICAAR